MPCCFVSVVLVPVVLVLVLDVLVLDILVLDVLVLDVAVIVDMKMGSRIVIVVINSRIFTIILLDMWITNVILIGHERLNTASVQTSLRRMTTRSRGQKSFVTRVHFFILRTSQSLSLTLLRDGEKIFGSE